MRPYINVMHKDNDNSLARPTSWIARTPFRNVATSHIFGRRFNLVQNEYLLCVELMYLLFKWQSIINDGAACRNNVVKTTKGIKVRKRETTNMFK